MLKKYAFSVLMFAKSETWSAWCNFKLILYHGMSLLASFGPSVSQLVSQFCQLVSH